MDTIRADMSQFYPMKSVLEQLFGKRCYRRLKETANLTDWKKETDKLLRCIELAIDTTVDVADDDWRLEIKNSLEMGRKNIKSAESITNLFSFLSATLTRLVFTQIGDLPYRGGVETVPLSARYWRLSGYRTVQYVQSKAQYQNQEQLREQRNKRNKNPT